MGVGFSLLFPSLALLVIDPPHRQRGPRHRDGHVHGVLRPRGRGGRAAGAPFSAGGGLPGGVLDRRGRRGARRPAQRRAADRPRHARPPGPTPPPEHRVDSSTRSAGSSVHSTGGGAASRRRQVHARASTVPATRASAAPDASSATMRTRWLPGAAAGRAVRARRARAPWRASPSTVTTIRATAARSPSRTQRSAAPPERRPGRSRRRAGPAEEPRQVVTTARSASAASSVPVASTPCSRPDGRADRSRAPAGRRPRGRAARLHQGERGAHERRGHRRARAQLVAAAARGRQDVLPGAATSTGGKPPVGERRQRAVLALGGHATRTRRVGGRIGRDEVDVAASLPAEATTTAPAAVASVSARRSWADTPSPLTDVLMIRAPWASA